MIRVARWLTSPQSGRRQPCCVDEAASCPVPESLRCSVANSSASLHPSIPSPLNLSPITTQGQSRGVPRALADIDSNENLLTHRDLPCYPAYHARATVRTTVAHPTGDFAHPTAQNDLDHLGIPLNPFLIFLSLSLHSTIYKATPIKGLAEFLF